MRRARGITAWSRARAVVRPAGRALGRHGRRTVQKNGRCLPTRRWGRSADPRPHQRPVGRSGRDDLGGVGGPGDFFRSTGPDGGTFVGQDGVASDNIHSLFQSADGDLWVGTEDAGVTRLRRGGFETITERENLHDQRARAMCEDGDGSSGWCRKAG